MAESLKGDVTATLQGMAFSFYTTEQIKALSVKRVVISPAFDLQGAPLPDALYDPAMGPLSRVEVCVTCGMRSKHCPGHCGHIELPVPVINPLLFSPLFALLKRTCFNCHNIKVKGGSRMMQRILARLALLDSGKVWEACAHVMTTKKTPDDGEEGVDCESSEDEAVPKSEGSTGKSSAEALEWETSLLSLTKRSEFVSAILSNCHSEEAKCPFCHSSSPKLRQYDSTKLLVDPMKPKNIESNRSRGVALHTNVFEQPIWNADGDGLSVKKSAVKKDGDDEDDEDEELVDDDLEKAAVIDDVLDMSSDDKHMQRRWMSPLEAQEHLRRAWACNPELLGTMYSHLIKLSDSSHQFKRVPSDSKIFFIEALIVPANRFRPPSKVTYGQSTGFAEHSHNMHLNRIIASCTKFVNTSKVQGAKDMTGMKARVWSEIQTYVKTYFNSPSTASDKASLGIQQVLDKKEGLFRRNMMGKRVNFAARTVISPDPYMETDEIGVPEVFARALTFPTPVTWLNHKEMAQAVINGTETYPGATRVEKDGVAKQLEHMSLEERKALSKILMEHNPLTPDVHSIVHRQLQTGDYVLLNRQPSLHKPSMLGQRVKVLGKERVMRMHYANCNTFNADFDGDEMNIHLPQSLNAKADTRFAAMSSDNYLGPKDGAPLRGLIQDHVLSGVLLTMRDTFFKREEYQQLVYGSVFLVRTVEDISLEIPAILKPVPMWTGKQVLSTIVKHILKGKPLFNYSGTCRVKGDMWGESGKEEGTVEFCGGDLVTGIIDKAQCGASANGFVHSCYTLYGGDVAERLLSCLGRVFTRYLESHGFTCGMDDFLLSPEAEKGRRKVLEQAQQQSMDVIRTFLGAEEDEDEDALRARLKARLLKSPEDEGLLDGVMKRVSHKLTSDVMGLAIPSGMMKRFPRNNFFLMVITGAKGSTVNFSMIACLLGQMELEGKRVARLVSGRTLPAFKEYQIDITAGGFIAQRFLTGVKPREFYFHNMAGREGLVDTAVKTSRSGYLQRCIIKHLETCVVAYDGTVRDSDGSMIQFAYGEDGLDPVHHQSVYNLKLWKSNAAVAQVRVPGLSRPMDKKVRKYHKAYFKGDTLHRFPDHERKLHRKVEKLEMDDSLLGDFSANHVGAVSDKFLDRLKEKDIEPGSALFDLMIRNYQRLLVSPGDNVGVLAGQSIGEPSTQMTLNTFHLAGHGDVNVTLGIPRLRELLMGATKPKIPSMSVELHKDLDPAALARFRQEWKNGSLDNIVSQVVCTRVVPVDQSYVNLNVVYLKFDPEACRKYGLSWREVVAVCRDQFSKLLIDAMVRDLRYKTRMQMVRESLVLQGLVGESQNAADAEVDDGEEGDGSKPKKSKKSKKSKKDATDDEEEEEEAVEGENQDPDDEDLEALEDERVDDFEDVEDEERILEAGTSGMDRVNKKGLSTERELVGSLDDNGFLSEPIPKKLREAKQQLVKLLGLAGHAGQHVFRIRFLTETEGPQVLISSMAEQVVKATRLRNMPLISKTVFSEATSEKGAQVITQGCDIAFMGRYGDVLNMKELRCNDIGHILETYGVEAARTALVEELGAVFGAYGINVSYRHLTLIADYQTFHGRYRGFNRHSMAKHKNSALLNMSFETTTRFASEAALRGAYDDLTSNSAQLVLGTPPMCGTGCMDILQPVQLL